MTPWHGVKALVAPRGLEQKRAHLRRLRSKWTNRSTRPVPRSRHGAIRRHWPPKSLFPMAGARRTRRQFMKLPRGRTSRRGGDGESSCWSPLRGAPLWRWRTERLRSTIAPMIEDLSTHQWLGRFAVRLMHLRQDIPLPHAVTRAVAAHGHSGELKPEDAAQIDAAVKTWALPRRVTEYRLDRRHADASGQS